MGTDSGITEHGQNLRELGLMVEAGMSPVEVDARHDPERGGSPGRRGHLGTIETGKRADLTIVDGDPFDYTNLADRIAAVYQDGRLVAGSIS